MEPLAAFLPQAHPEAPVLNEDIFHAHTERRADPRETEDHESDQRPVAQPDWGADVDAVEQKAGFGRIEYGCLPLAHAVGGSADRGGRIQRHDLAGDEPVEQMAQRGEAQLGRGRRALTRLQLDPSRDVQWLYVDDRADTLVGAPGEEIPHRATIGAPRVRVADRRREELEESDAGTLAAGDDEDGQRVTVERSERARVIYP